VTGWLVEQGIGEDRAIRLVDDAVVAAAIDWPGSLAPGLVEDARLIARPAGSSRGTLRFANGELAQVDRLPREASEGQLLRAEVTRSAMAEQRRHKLASARPTERSRAPAPSLAKRLGARVVAAFPADLWEEVHAEAWSGEVAFAGGSLTISPTPARTLIDIDGALPPAQLALAAVPAVAGAIRRLGLGGSIAIDFPTLAIKVERRAVDEALETALAGWTGERTAMNGFGFVQLVARLERPSLAALYQRNPARVAANMLERMALSAKPGGTLVLHANPALRRGLAHDFSAELRRRAGREFTWAWDDDIALQSPFVQTVPA